MNIFQKITLMKTLSKKSIQTITFISIILGGGLITLITLIIDIQDNNFSKELISNPNWKINIEYNGIEDFNDIISIESKNENINIVSMEMMYYINDSINYEKDYKNQIITERFKNSIIEDIITLNHSKSNWNPNVEFMAYEIPVAFKIKYEFLGEIKTDIRIYKYKVLLRILQNKFKLESVDFDFVKKINDNDFLKKELILTYLVCNSISDSATSNNTYVTLELGKLNPVYQYVSRFYDVMRLSSVRIIKGENPVDLNIGGEVDTKKGLLTSKYDSLDKFGRTGYLFTYNIRFTNFYKAYKEMDTVTSYIVNNQNLFNYEINNTVPAYFDLLDSIYSKDHEFIFYTNTDTIATFSIQEAVAFEKNNYYLKNKWDSLNYQILAGLKKLINFEEEKNETLKKIK